MVSLFVTGFLRRGDIWECEEQFYEVMVDFDMDCFYRRLEGGQSDFCFLKNRDFDVLDDDGRFWTPRMSS